MVATEPRASASAATTAFDAPADSTRGWRLPSSKMTYWIAAIATPSGTNSSPIPRKRAGSARYRRRADATSEPQGRRRATRNGDDSFQRVRDASQMISADGAASTTSTRDGSPTNAVRTLDPAATAPQKKSVAERPSERPDGTAKLVSRQLVRAQVIGACHLRLVFGPVGPS